MPAHDLDLLIDAAEAAGEIATRFTGAKAARWDKPNDAGPVTEADLAVNDMLHDKLRTARPNYGWLSEETEDTAGRLAHDKVFIIDPIDGTRSFVEGSKTWAHSLAVAEAGHVTAAVVFLPMRDKLYAAAVGQGATLNGEPIGAATPKPMTQTNVLTTRPVLKPENWVGQRIPAFRRSYRPSLAYRLALVAEGRFDAMITLRASWEWDIAAGALLVSEAGGRVSDQSGAALTFNKSDPRHNGVAAGGTACHQALIAALA
ncbi:MAG: 3'(2'),5'-bisphosphate nucleotidase CysQ [Pseudomonadota bacterium]